MGFKAEVLVDGTWGQNGVVWPDMESAERAAADLFSRWTLTTDHRAVEVDEEPNRQTWERHHCATCKRIGDGMGPGHDGSARCESGSIASGGRNAHCTCDTCF